LHFTYFDVAKMIDHSLFNPTLTKAELESGFPHGGHATRIKVAEAEYSVK
jgi:deoxyribose-phosphate aldolase